MMDSITIMRNYELASQKLEKPEIHKNYAQARFSNYNCKTHQTNIWNGQHRQPWFWQHQQINDQQTIGLVFFYKASTPWFTRNASTNQPTYQNKSKPHPTLREHQWYKPQQNNNSTNSNTCERCHCRENSNNGQHHQLQPTHNGERPHHGQMFCPYIRVH